MLDLVVRGGLVVDGSGGPPVLADVGVRDQRIVEVGRVSERAYQVIDADGAVVLPGWVDAHTHYDGQVTWDDLLEGSASNGVTTVVFGNCGVGFAPVPPGHEETLIDLMEGVEDIPGAALFEGIPWGRWETFPEYLDFLAGSRWTLDVGALLAHAPLRYYVMRERAVADADPAPDDVARMAEIADAAFRAGALGFSTSRIRAHRSVSGSSVPGTFAPDWELAAIVGAMRAAGGGILQAIPTGTVGEVAGLGPEPATIAQDVRLFGTLSRAHRVPVTFTVLQIAAAPDEWRQTLAVAAEENHRGARLSPMVMPRGGTALTTLRGYHLFRRRPSYLRLAELPLPQLVAELRRPEVRRAILAETDVVGGRPGAMECFLPQIFAAGLATTFELTDPIDYEPSPASSVAARARARGIDPDEMMYDFLLEDDGTSVAVLLKSNYVNGNLDPCREMLDDPNTVSGLSDAGAHVNFVCDMSTPTFHLTHWVRDRSRGERLPIEVVVRKATSVPARLFGLEDRGSIEIGKRADINVVDLENLTMGRPYLRSDLPAGGQRFLQDTTGYLATTVRGVVTRRHDEQTDARPGRLLRRPV